MIKPFLLSVPLVFAALASGQAPVRDTPQAVSQPRPSAATIHRWQERKFGMFIHFGLFSEFGGMYRGKPVDNGYSEQIMANAPIPVEEYAAAARTFNPAKWDPDAVVALAKAAGMKYIVITAKHHDGFNMFATAQTKYNVVDGTPYGQDIVRGLAAACKRGGLGFGVYYSTIDWHQPGMDHYIEGNSNELTDAHADFNVAQLKELMTHYGPIDEIWFDMGKPTPAQSLRFTTTVHDLQPQAMVSGRVWNYEGDFAVMGDNQVPRYGIDEPWETPASIFPHTWGYRSWEHRDDLQGKIQENIQRLVQVVSRGGNYILNIGPEGDGSIVPYEADTLRGVGQWLRVHGEAVYGAAPTALGELGFGYTTQKGDSVYLFLNKTAESIVLPHTAATHWKSATLLGTGQTWTIHARGADTVIDPPEQQAAGFMPVLRLRTVGGLRVAPAIPQWPADGHLVLTTALAERFYNYNGRGYEAPATVYKLRWRLPSGCAQLTVHSDGHDAPVSIVSGGTARPVVLQNGAGQKVSIGKDYLLEVTPPEPFVKGTPLPLSLQSIDASRCPAGA